MLVVDCPLRKAVVVAVTVMTVVGVVVVVVVAGVVVAATDGPAVTGQSRHYCDPCSRS